MKSCGHKRGMRGGMEVERRLLAPKLVIRGWTFQKVADLLPTRSGFCSTRPSSCGPDQVIDQFAARQNHEEVVACKHRAKIRLKICQFKASQMSGFAILPNFHLNFLGC